MRLKACQQTRTSRDSSISLTIGSTYDLEVLPCTLCNSLNLLQLLRGSFQGILNQKETQGLAEELEAFYSQYLHSYDRNLTLLNSIPGVNIFV